MFSIRGVQDGKLKPTFVFHSWDTPITDVSGADFDGVAPIRALPAHQCRLYGPLQIVKSHTQRIEMADKSQAEAREVAEVTAEDQRLADLSARLRDEAQIGTIRVDPARP